MSVIGIDPGTARTGYGIVEEDETGAIKLIEYGVFETEANLETEKRLQKIYQALERIIKLHHPSTGAVEKLFFQKNVTNAISVGQARGVILLALANSNIPLFEYTPNEVKQSVTGYGAADKKQVQTMVKTLLNLQEIPKPDDAADAIAIAICHIHSSSFTRLEKLGN